MAKQRKTRKQKVRSDKRHEHVFAKPSETNPEPQSETTVRYQFTPSNKTSSETKIQTVTSHEYDYVKRDLLKTGVVTGSIIVAQLILFFVIR